METERQIDRKEVFVEEGAAVPFHNQVDFCVGTGRMGLALQKEYMDQLALVQEEIGFSHIRGHGLFSDDMAIYQEYTDAEGNRHAEYNFTYLDLVMDGYLSLGIRPFLELGFMPAKLASGEQTIFYWKGNTTPPKDYADWCALVQATLRHLLSRYGEDVVNWPVEVWNEPNLAGFWENADMQEYFRLFGETFRAVKAVDERFAVGGPAICGVDDERWMRCFLEFCRDKGIKPDHITRHHYTIHVPERDGHYGYPGLAEPEEGLADLQVTRDIVDSFPEFAGLPIHITEFNTSYSPDTPLHDTNQNAAYIAFLLSRLGDMNESYSYWTFGDIFEEQGVPFTPFHGGFGLVADGCIPKPTFWTFAFFRRLKDAGRSGGENTCVYRGDSCVIVRRPDGEYRGVAWNHGVKRQGRELELEISLPACGTEYSLVTQTVDEVTCNPLKLWHDLGEPASLSAEEKKLLKEAARPLTASGRQKASDGTVRFTLEVSEFGVVYFALKPSVITGDRGFDYERVVGNR